MNFEEICLKVDQIRVPYFKYQL